MEVIKTDIATVYIAEIQQSKMSRRDNECCTVRDLLAAVLPGATIMHYPSGAPYVDIDGVFISVSHSQHYAALAVAATPIGIDIEEPRITQLQRVASRFMSPDDYKACPDLLRAWTAKEAVFKAAGRESAMLADISLICKDNILSASLFNDFFTIEHIQFPNFLLALSVGFNN